MPFRTYVCALDENTYQYRFNTDFSLFFALGFLHRTSYASRGDGVGEPACRMDCNICVE